MMAGEFVALLDKVWDELRADTDPRFDPPHSTVQANVIHGGTAVNILAKEAEITWEYRLLPGRDGDAIIETVKRRAAEVQALHLHAKIPRQQRLRPRRQRADSALPMIIRRP